MTECQHFPESNRKRFIPHEDSVDSMFFSVVFDC